MPLSSKTLEMMSCVVHNVPGCVSGWMAWEQHWDKMDGIDGTDGTDGMNRMEHVEDRTERADCTHRPFPQPGPSWRPGRT
mmetsp:Transcript_22679/g.51975  ORF Transcript_22679/g.51975 Transcript_22679/m.51975 type:complete len:80 (-) Transcript_22679:62-301(-)